MIAVGKGVCVFLSVASSLYCIWLLWHGWQHARFAWKPTPRPASQGHDSDDTRLEWFCQLVLALAALWFAVIFVMANGNETISLLWHSEAHSQQLPTQTGFARSPADFGAFVERDSFRAGRRVIGIDCTRTQVSDEQVAYLLRRAPELEWLNLSWTSITGDGLGELRFTPLLCCLTLYGCQITDEGLVHLEGLTNLQELDLVDTQVTDEGLVHLEGLTNLQELDLVNTQVTDEGLFHLEGLTNLQELDLYGTQVTEEGLKRLQRAIPRCSVRH